MQNDEAKSSSRGRGKRTLAALATMGGAVLLTVALGATPAHAGTKTGGPKSCSSGYHVVLASKSSGSTKHWMTIAGYTKFKDHGSVSSSSPWRYWNGGGFYRNIDSWKVTATVLESAGPQCWQTPQ